MAAAAAKVQISAYWTGPNQIPHPGSQQMTRISKVQLIFRELVHSYVVTPPDRDMNTTLPFFKSTEKDTVLRTNLSHSISSLRFPSEMLSGLKVRAILQGGDYIHIKFSSFNPAPNQECEFEVMVCNDKISARLRAAPNVALNPEQLTLYNSLVTRHKVHLIFCALILATKYSWPASAALNVRGDELKREIAQLDPEQTTLLNQLAESQPLNKLSKQQVIFILDMPDQNLIGLIRNTLRALYPNGPEVEVSRKIDEISSQVVQYMNDTAFAQNLRDFARHVEN